MSVRVSVYPHHKTKCVCEAGILCLLLGSVQIDLDENLDKTDLVFSLFLADS